MAEDGEEEEKKKRREKKNVDKRPTCEMKVESD